DAARQEVSLSLSGPLALTACVLYFAQRAFSLSQVRAMAWCAVIPIAGISAIVLQGTVTADDLEYVAQIPQAERSPNSRERQPAAPQVQLNLQSNEVLTAGFDANKVSCALGLGGMLGAFLALQARGGASRLLPASLAILFTAQALISLSRGGVYSELVALA